MNRKLRIVLIVIFALIFVGSGGYLAVNLIERGQGRAEYAGIQEQMGDLERLVIPSTQLEDPKGFDLVDNRQVIAERMAAMAEQNDDLAAWLYIPGTDINLPVMQAGDNEYYLKRSFSRQYRSCGSLFLDWRNDPGFDNLNSVIYGHNMRDGSMFCSLLDYKDADFFNQHRTVYIFLPDGSQLTYEIFSVYVTDGWDDYWDLELKGDPEAFIAQAAARSLHRADPSPLATGEVLTLSTCEYSTDEGRFAVHARRMVSPE